MRFSSTFVLPRFTGLKAGLLWVAEMLETMDSLLTVKWGPKWWLNTPLAQWAPKAA
jgi:hypothetical protein